MSRTREENAADLAHEEAWRDSLVPIFVAVSGEASDPSDEGVQGVYSVMVDPALTEEEKAEAALDHFHDNNGVEVLDDFNIVVFDAEGKLLPRMERHENGSLLGRAEYEGQLNDVDVPSAVKAGIESVKAPSP